MTQPLLYVEAPPIAPYKYGLFSVAQPADSTDDHVFNGVEYEVTGAYPAGVEPGSCYQGAQTTITLPNCLGTAQGLPFSVYAGIDSATVGHTEQEQLDRANLTLKLGAQHAVEKALWTGAGLTSGLNAASTVTIGTALSPTDAVAAGEDYLAKNYNGIGVFHAPRLAAPRLNLERQIIRSNVGAALETALGTSWVFGAGYDNTGPSGAAPGTSIAWMYITGQITIRRGTPFINGNLGAAVNRSTNRVLLFAEQQHVTTIDSFASGVIAAVSIDLTK